MPDSEQYDMVVVDESHKFRNDYTEMYIVLQEISQEAAYSTGRKWRYTEESNSQFLQRHSTIVFRILKTSFTFFRAGATACWIPFRSATCRITGYWVSYPFYLQRQEACL